MKSDNSSVSGENVYKCCFTGYRPSKFPFTLEREDREYKKFENALIKELLKLVNGGCRVFYSGMAMGFDIIAAETVLLLKNFENLPKIELVCVLPFESQSSTFTSYWKQRFDNVILNCDKKIVLSKEYFSGCYQKRNIFMVDSCDYVLTWYDGKPGGTQNTIDYALRKQRHVFNINKSGMGSFAVQTYFDIL